MSSQDIDYEKEVELLLSSRFINTFMASYLLKLNRAGLNESMWQEALDDAIGASKAGVDTQEEFITYFYIDHFVEDLVESIMGTKLSDAEEEDLKQYMFELRNSIDYSDIASFKIAIVHWLEKNNKTRKTAHPNSGKSYQVMQKYDLDKWQHLAKQILIAIGSGENKRDILTIATKSLNGPEKYDFLVWFNYYYNQENRKYDVGPEIRHKNRALRSKMASLSKIGISSDERYYYVPTFKTPMVVEDKSPVKLQDEKSAVDFEAVRKKMMSRIFSIDRLLEKYRKVLSDTQVDGIETTLNDLKSKVRKLKMASSIEDCMIKTAGILLNKFAFKAGADALLALAVEEDLAEKPPVANKQQDALKQIVEEMYILSHKIKNRGLIRELARIDMQLNAIHMSSFFPEITDAQAKLIDAFGYVSNKLDDVMPKLQGGLSMQHLEKALDEEEDDIATEVKHLSKNLKVPTKEPVAPAPAGIAKQPAPAARPTPPLRPTAPAVEDIEVPR